MNAMRFPNYHFSKRNLIISVFLNMYSFIWLSAGTTCECLKNPEFCYLPCLLLRHSTVKSSLIISYTLCTCILFQINNWQCPLHSSTAFHLYSVCHISLATYNVLSDSRRSDFNPLLFSVALVWVGELV